jgi:hypothetical protein
MTQKCNISYEENYLLRYNAVYSVQSEPTYRKNIERNHRERWQALFVCFHAGFMSSYSSALKKDTICFSEASVNGIQGVISQKILLFTSNLINGTIPFVCATTGSSS